MVEGAVAGQERGGHGGATVRYNPLIRQDPDAKEQAVPRILSGVQPTGNLHVGNYVGARRSEGAGT